MTIDEQRLGRSNGNIDGVDGHSQTNFDTFQRYQYIKQLSRLDLYKKLAKALHNDDRPLHSAHTHRDCRRINYIC